MMGAPVPVAPGALRALCVSVHDVAPATWQACSELIAAVRAVADIPLTLLVVPQFHGDAAPDPAFDAELTRLAARGHELALHGYRHLDEGPAPQGLRARLLRRGYTTGEGEFAAIDTEEARRRIALGLGWFAARGWRPSGFVAPAWLLGKGAWEALCDDDFAYTTTYRYLHLLPQRRALHSPALVYSARNRGGRWLSPPALDALAFALRGAPLVRLCLHPRDAEHPALLRHAQGLIARLAARREALTKAALAARLGAPATSTDPSSCPAPSAAVRTRSSTTDRSAACPPWR